MESELCITVTHFINPHVFWFKTTAADNFEHVHVLNTLERSLEQLYRNKPSFENQLRPEVGDKVAVNFIARNKFIRAEILEKAEFQQEEYIVWAIDYGFPLLTRKEYLRRLPTNLLQDFGHIQIGGIANVYPAEQEYDDEEGNLVLVKKDKWLQKTCNMVEKLLTDATLITFVPSFQNNSNQHNWGELVVVNHRGNKINVLDYLLKTTNAIKVEDELDFQKKCSKMNTIKVAPWLSNDRNTKMKFNTIKHNYDEHSQQMVATIIGEQAKRKVEDWQKRNVEKMDQYIDMPEPTFIEPDNSADVDDITFEDSVSVVQERLYMRKAGAITKNKRQTQKANDVSPAILAKAFQMDDIGSEKNVDISHRSSESFPLVDAESTNISHRLQNLAELHISSVRNEKEELAVPDKTLTAQIHAFKRNESSSTSSNSLRYKKLVAMRRKTANAENQIKSIDKSNNETKELFTDTYNEKQNFNTTASTKNSDSFSYHLLEQSTTLSTPNQSTIKHSQDNTSDITAKSLRVKRLVALRKKIDTSSNVSMNAESYIDKIKPHEEQFEAKGSDVLLDNTDFELKPKAISKVNNNTTQLKDVPPLTQEAASSAKKKNINEKLKIDQLGYDSLNVVPAGYDVTRLYSYKNEETHWHRKKTTRFDAVVHDSTTSTDEFQLSNDKNDQSFSSSDLFQTSPPRVKSHDTISHQILSKNRTNKDSRCSNNFETSRTSVERLISSEMSTLTNSATLNQKIHKRRKLTSPSSQLSKIEHILQQHNIEKELGNTNILNLKQLNVSSSSQKSILVSSSSNDSAFERNIKLGSTARPYNYCSSSSSQSATDKIQNEKHLKDVCNYEALMEIKHTEQFPIVEGEQKIQTKFIDHLVLAHSSIQLMPIESISDVPFLPEIHEEMRQMRVNKVYRIHVYSWSHVLRNNSLFVVNPPRSGKTWSYLPPLCSLICCRRSFTSSSFGPMAIILVASLQHVELISSCCRRIMSGLKADAPSCIPSYGMRNFIETKIQLLNGCGILVATPSSLVRLLQDNVNEPLFNSERLQHIVIDDMDIAMSRSQNDIENALRILFKLAKQNKYKKLTPQLIVTSRDWDALIVKLIRKSNQPLLLIGDFLEAAVYGRASISIKLKSSREKNEAVVKFLKKITKSTSCINNRTLIICNDDEDVEKVLIFLQKSGYPSLGYYNRSTEIERITVEEWKNKISSQIIVCTDVRFCELKIQNVNNLIHYSMPTSWTRFTKRFSALAQTYKNYVSCSFEEIVLSTTSNEPNAHSMILLDENNNMQLPRLVDFMRNHNQFVHEEIVKVSKRVMVQIEEEKILKKSNLCPQLLEFGECDETRCDNRHVLTCFDVINKRDDIPCAGELRIHILKVFSPTHYAVRLLRHKLPNSSKWIEVRRSSEALAFAIQLDMHYRNKENLSLHWPPNANDLCVYEYADNFRRARIIEVPVFEQNKSTNVVQSNLKVTLKLIDDGAIISSVKCNEIFVCDDKFRNFPAQAIDIRLMNVVPFDNERTWDSKTTKQVQKWLMEDIKSDYVIQASIDFSLANTIWVKNVVVMQKLAGIDAYCQIVHLKKSLVEKGFGVIYKGDRKHVRDLVGECDLVNVPENKIDNEDSDLDYQSCKNDSINLIKFSSSNDSSMTSAAEHNVGVAQNIDQESNSFENAIDVNECLDKDNIDPVYKEDHDVVALPLNASSKTVPIAETNIDSTQNITQSKTESWSQLPLNEIVKVEIGDENDNGNWENIFLQIIDGNSMFLFEELNMLINNHIDNIKSSQVPPKEVDDFVPSHNCLVKYDNKYLRAKVYGVYGENKEQRLYRFFLCDYACFTNVKYQDLYKDFLYETTEEIVTFTPYQAVHCTLAGITWDTFTKRYQVTRDYLYACAVLECDTKEMSSVNLPINSYKILLYECENENEFSSALLFNKTLLENGITVCDEETKTFLDFDIRVNEEESKEYKRDMQSDKERANSKSEVITCEELIKSIQSGVFNIDLSGIMDPIEDQETIENSDEYANSCIGNIKAVTFNSLQQIDTGKNKTHIDRPKIPISDSEAEEQGHCSSNSDSNKSSMSLISTEDSNCSVELLSPPPLKALHRRPLTTWYENDCMIFLSIYAPDVKEYLLEVGSKTLLFVAFIQGEKSVLHVNFLGYIKPQYVSHEIKGLNVVIRLTKLVYEKWPRLLNESTKYSWLKYNLNTFDSNEMQHVMPQQYLHTIMENNDLYFSGARDGLNSDDDSERELYQTFNPILDNEDDCDPFSI